MKPAINEILIRLLLDTAVPETLPLSDDDWQAFLQHAHRHGVSPLLHKRISADPALEAKVPVTVQAGLRDAYLWNWSALRLALSVLDAHGGNMRGATWFP